MNPEKQFKTILKKTKILKNPKHRLATFGQTKIPYFYLSEMKGFKDRSRLRQGIVTAEKPKLITPESLRKRFEGFGEEADDFGHWLGETYGEFFRGLEYQFKNESSSVHVEYSSLKDLIDQVESRLQSSEIDKSAIIQGPDATWQISMMKFIVDECLSSYQTNIRDLDEHGFFDDPIKVSRERKSEIEKFFTRAKGDRSLLPILGKKLHEYGLFKEFEDRFLKLYR